jgi:hypothetical protein
MEAPNGGSLRGEGATRAFASSNLFAPQNNAAGSPAGSLSRAADGCTASAALGLCEWHAQAATLCSSPEQPAACLNLCMPPHLSKPMQSMACLAVCMTPHLSMAVKAMASLTRRTPPHLSTALQTLRKEIKSHEQMAMQRSQAGLPTYQAQVATYRARSAPLDHSKFNTDRKVQEYYALPRSLATNNPTYGPKVNVNHLRFKRDTEVGNTVPHDGGPSYNGAGLKGHPLQGMGANDPQAEGPDTRDSASSRGWSGAWPAQRPPRALSCAHCVPAGEVVLGNYVEERRDPGYKSGFHPKELRKPSRWKPGPHPPAQPV